MVTDSAIPDDRRLRVRPVGGSDVSRNVRSMHSGDTDRRGDAYAGRVYRRVDPQPEGALATADPHNTPGQ